MIEQIICQVCQKVVTINRQLQTNPNGSKYTVVGCCENGHKCTVVIEQDNDSNPTTQLRFGASVVNVALGDFIQLLDIE